jgi:hypothetical protein
MGVAATEMTATEMAATVREIARFVFIGVLDGRSGWTNMAGGIGVGYVLPLR